MGYAALSLEACPQDLILLLEIKLVHCACVTYILAMGQAGLKSP
jgi:hypothetical protein